MDSKLLISNIIVTLILEDCLLNFVYFIFRIYNYYHHQFWKPFLRSDFFRVNYILEHLKWTKEYDQRQQKLMQEVRPWSEFLEAIKVETG